MEVHDNPDEDHGVTGNWLAVLAETREEATSWAAKKIFRTPTDPTSTGTYTWDWYDAARNKWAGDAMRFDTTEL